MAEPTTTVRVSRKCLKDLRRLAKADQRTHKAMLERLVAHAVSQAENPAPQQAATPNG